MPDSESKITRIFQANLHWVGVVALAAGTIAMAFYSLSSKVDVQAERIAQLQQQLTGQQQIIQAYQTLANSINNRLSFIEGKLDLDTPKSMKVQPTSFAPEEGSPLSAALK